MVKYLYIYLSFHYSNIHYQKISKTLKTFMKKFQLVIIDKNNNEKVQLIITNENSNKIFLFWYFLMEIGIKF
jgi:hypothetical protein